MPHLKCLGHLGLPTVQMSCLMPRSEVQDEKENVYSVTSKADTCWAVNRRV